MYFKRPSFRNGGRGTGIEQLTPRVKASMGFPNFGVTQGDNTGYQEYLKQMRAKRDSGEPSGIAKMFLGPRFTDENFVSPFLRPDKPFFSNRTGFEFLKPGVNRTSPEYITSKVEENKISSDASDLASSGYVAAGGGKDMGRFQLQEDGTYIDTNSGDVITEDQITTILSEERRKPNDGPDDPPEILPGETSMREAIEGEVDILKDLLKDTGASKGEKALILAKAIKTPGTIADKLEAGAEDAVKLAKEQRKQDKALILTAYKNYKAKELADGKLNTQETAVKNYVNKKLADPNNKKKRNELELEAWEIVIKGTGSSKDLNKEFATAMLTSMNIQYQDALRDLQKYANKQDAASQKKIAEAQKIISDYKKYAEIAGITIPGLAEGGRVNRAFGTPETGEIAEAVDIETVQTPTEKVQATEVTAAENIEPMKEVPVMNFATLRNRLPQEITDDIVQLLANSKEALQDFYYINSQNDVSNFNTKYGVNLILPPSVLA